LPTTTSWYGGDFRRIKEIAAKKINDLHRLYWSEHWPVLTPAHTSALAGHSGKWRARRSWYRFANACRSAHFDRSRAVRRQRTSKLDPFKATIKDWLGKDATVSSTVIEQRLRPLGYTGGHSILREYLQKVRRYGRAAVSVL
jgi:hypothetical protein